MENIEILKLVLNCRLEKMKNKELKIRYLERRNGDQFRVIRINTQLDEEGYFNYSFENRHTGSRCSMEAFLEHKKSMIILNNGMFFKKRNEEIINEHLVFLRLKKISRGNNIYEGEYVDEGNTSVSVEMRVKMPN